MLTPSEWEEIFYADLIAHDHGSDRSLQAKAGIIGPSDLVCRERARRIVVEAPRTDEPSMNAAILGTYIHEGITRARSAINPDLLHEVAVEITLPSGPVMVGHADEVDPKENSVTDFKTVNDVAYRRKVGPEAAHIRQVHLYALGLVQAGILQKDPIVRLAYIDRSGKEPRPYVYQQRYDHLEILMADDFVGDVIYAVREGEEATKDWPREKCRRFCPYYSGCRPDDRAGLPVESTEASAAALVYFAAHQEQREATKIKEQAREHLIGVDGVTPEGMLVRWTRVNTDDGGYDRLDVRQVGPAQA